MQTQRLLTAAAFVGGALALLVSVAAVAADTPAATAASPMDLNKPGAFEKSMGAFVLLFGVAVLLEHAFSTIFNWRVFQAYFSLSGVKTIIMVAVSLAVVWKFDLDILTELINGFRTVPAKSDGLSQVITALILAGGSAGVFKIMQALGYRGAVKPETVTPTPPKDKAWMAVWVKRRAAVGDIHVRIRNLGAADASSPAPIAGTVTSRRQALSGLLFRNANRFPQNGGHVMAPGIVYEISVEGKDENGNPLKALDTERHAFAPGAVVDFTVTL